MLAVSGMTGSADGKKVNASFDRPEGVSVDFLGTVYVADTGNGRVCRISPEGEAMPAV